MLALVFSQISPQKPIFLSAPPSFYAEPTTSDEINLQTMNLGKNRFLKVAKNSIIVKLMLGCLLFKKFKKFNEYCSLPKAAGMSTTILNKIYVC